MSGQEAPRARSHADEIQRLHPRWTFAGILGNDAHCGSSGHVSGHCWTAQFQEGPLVNPATGQLVDYEEGFANALDETYWDDVLAAAAHENSCLLGPFSEEFRYTIDHRTGRGRIPAWRGGGTFTSSSGHPHVHHSYTPWATHRTHPIHGPGPMTPAVRRRLLRLARAEARRRRVLEVRDVHPHRPGIQYMRGRDVAEVQIVLGRPVANPYGPGTSRAVADLQEFFGGKPTGIVDRRTWTLVLFIYLAHGFGY